MNYLKIATQLYAFIYFQVSTGTGIMSHFVNLFIVVPEAFIVGSQEHHVDLGSTISLVCMIEKVSLSSNSRLLFLTQHFRAPYLPSMFFGTTIIE